jgi:hypothetical protein
LSSQPMNEICTVNISEAIRRINKNFFIILMSFLLGN